MKRFLPLLAAVCLAVVPMFPGHAMAKQVFLTLASGSPGGVYYPLGGGMAVVIEKTVPGLRCAAESTGGSVENSRLVGNGSADMGMAMGSIVFKAVHGKKPFHKKYPLETLFQMYPAPEHIVTTKGSGINSIHDLKGKRVSIDVPGSGCATMAKVILKEAGYNLKTDLKIAHLSQSEAVQALKDGVIDAAFFNFAYPASAIMDLTATRNIKLIPLDKKFADKVVKKYPYYVEITIPAKTYDKIDKSTLCLGDSNLIVVNKDMKKKLAYKIDQAIFSNVKQGKYALVNIHPIAAQITPKNAINTPVPLHPGSVAYFKQVGALK